MKRLEELGISKTPWKVIPYGESTDSKMPTNGDIGFANGETLYLRDGGITLPTIADARLIAASPKRSSPGIQIQAASSMGCTFSRFVLPRVRRASRNMRFTVGRSGGRGRANEARMPAAKARARR